MSDIPLDGIDPADVDDESSTFAKTVAVVAALVVLLGSVVALLGQRAGGEAQRHAVIAQDLALETVRLQATGHITWQTAHNRDTDSRVLRTRAFEAWRAGDDDRAVALVAAADDLHKDTDFLREPEYTSDPYRPMRYLSEAFTPSIATNISRTASAETAAAWVRRADAYTAILTVLAAVLFLLGLSLITRVGRYAFFGIAATLGLTGLALTAKVSTDDISAPSNAALNAIADGERLQVQGDHELAIDAYTTAIELSDGYHSAYAHRANARRADDADLDPRETYMERIDGAELDLALDDVRAARARGGDDSTVVNALAALLIHDEQFESSEDLLVDLLDDDPRFAIALSNLGAARVGNGNASGAADAYRTMLSVAHDDLARLSRWSLYATARSVLEEVAMRRPEQHALAAEMSTLITLGQLGQEPAPNTPAVAPAGEVGPGQASIQQRGMWLSVTVPNSFPRGTPVAYVWYRRDVGQSLWVQPTAMARFTQLSGGGVDHNSQMMGTCPVPGDYRVDVVAAGALLASAKLTVPATTGNRYAFEEDLSAGATVCRPADWQRVDGNGRELVVTNPEVPAHVRVSATRLDQPELVLADQAAQDAHLDQIVVAEFDPSFASTEPPRPFVIANLAGRLHRRTAANGRVAIAFAALDGALVRVVVAEGTQDSMPALGAVIDTATFLWVGPP